MNEKQISSIIKLSETLNYRAAAEELFVSQPALTYQIQAAEEELGFAIFNHTGKKTSLTPAGEQFCSTLRLLQRQYRRAVEDGQNFSSKYSDNITIGLPFRSAFRYLPEAMQEFMTKEPSISITPVFGINVMERYLQGQCDILFGFAQNINQLSETITYPFYESRIYVILRKDDPLADKKIIKAEDLKNRELMVGGGSPKPLYNAQQSVLDMPGVHSFNSPDHDTTLVNTAAGKGIALSLGMLNDGSDDFAWIPFETDEKLNCVLCKHINDKRKAVTSFIRILMDIQKEHEKELW